jgi:septal ring factor EnvC (AmiA/AmiB activator)
MIGFRRAPGLSVLSITTIAFSLFAFGLFSLVAVNIRKTLTEVESRVEIRAFLADGTPVEVVSAAMGDIGAFPEVSRVEYVSPDSALARARSELGEFKDVFESAFLPASIDIRMREGHRDPETVKTIAGRIKSFEFVDDIRYGEDWVDKLYRIRNVATATGLVLGLAFAAVAVIIIGATIRMAVMARAREISIMRLGGRDGRVHPPAIPDRWVPQGNPGRVARPGPHLVRQSGDQPQLHPDGVLLARPCVARLVRRRADWCDRQLAVGRATPAKGLMRRTRILLCVAALAAPLAARSQQPQPPSQGQTSGEAKIRQQREELERIRREREDLQRNMTELQSKAHDLDAEVTNLHQQADATARVVRSLDVQLETITTEVDGTTSSLLRAEDELAVKKAVLQRRLIDIYKRGPMYTTEALLAARTFGELLGRYKYLHELALRDRSLVARVEDLYDQVAKQRQQLVRLRNEFERSRQEKREEEERLRALEESRSRNLNVIKRSAKETQARLVAIGRDETRLENTIAAFEEARKKAAERPNAPTVLSSSTLKTSDFGKLDWPVEGSIIYRFGRAVNPNNTTIRWNGVGIAAPSGASVKAVAGGEVMVAEAIGTYGLTVIVQHGGGDYSVYGSLSRIDVQKGQQVIKGQVIGAVGVSDPELDPHLHFEIRPKGRAIDPLVWLRGEQK